jgi:hypothetical protein
MKDTSNVMDDIFSYSYIILLLVYWGGGREKNENQKKMKANLQQKGWRCQAGKGRVRP